MHNNNTQENTIEKSAGSGPSEVTRIYFFSLINLKTHQACVNTNLTMSPEG